MKMKVGDMELSAHDGIHFGSNPPQSSRPTSQPAISTTSKTTTWPGGPPAATSSRPIWTVLPLPAYKILALFFGLIALLFGIAAYWAMEPLLLVPSAAGFILSILMTLGIFFGNHSADAPSSNLDLSEVATERRMRLFLHLKQSNQPRTVESLRDDLGWTEEALLKALQGLLLQKRISEDLDLESGHWTYQLTDSTDVVLDLESASPTTQLRHTLPLSERLEAIEANQPSTNTSHNKSPP